MEPTRWNAIQEVFEEALAGPAAARDAFLAVRCRGDDALRAEVAALLDAHDRPHDLLRETDAGRFDVLDALLSQDPSDVAGQLGPYTLVRELGRGGMATVYLARREDVGLDVALKLVRAWLATPELRHRLLFERRVLARLDHPNVARLLDAGITHDALPYFAMEYVDGRPIDRYCDEHRLPLDARLRLFLDVCRAVEYAHRNLIVHRDLKPSNILVVPPAPGSAVPGTVKLLDFGIAKVLEEDADTPQTRTGMRFLTPEYASPEQLAGGVVTTASDVYQLGVLLYELLAGRRPSARAEAVPGSPEATLPPSSALARADADAAASIAQARSTTREALVRSLRGDLDTIVLYALRAEPERRYASAGQLYDDLRRHLDGHPVTARPDTVRYRLCKFVRRHRAPVTAALLAALLLVGLSTWYTVSVRQERDRARREAAKSTQALAFIQDLFASSDPRVVNRADTLRVRDVLDRGAEQIWTEFDDEPEVRLHLMQTLGTSYGSLGLFTEALPLFEEARRLHAALYGRSDAAYLRLLAALGGVTLNMQEIDAAEAYFIEALALSKTVHGADHPMTVELEADLLDTFRYQERWDAADSMLAHLHHRIATDSAALRRDEPELLALLLNNVGTIMSERGHLAEGVALQAQSVLLERQWREPTDPAYIRKLHNLALLKLKLGQPKEALPLVRETIDLSDAVFDDDHILSLHHRNGLAAVLLDLGRHEEAEAVLRDNLAAFARQGAAEQVPMAFIAMGRHACALHRLGRLDEAVAAWRDLLPRIEETWVADLFHASWLDAYGLVLYDRSAAAAAEQQFRAAIAMFEEAHPDRADRTRPLFHLARLLVDEGRLAEADTVLQAARSFAETRLPAGHWYHGVAGSITGYYLTARRRYAEAEPLLRASFAQLARTFEPDDYRVDEARRYLTALLEATGRADEAAALRTGLLPPEAVVPVE